MNKLLTFLFACLFSLSFMACQEDTEETVTCSGPIVGSWKLVEYGNSGCDDPAFDNTFTCTDCYFITFKPDCTFEDSQNYGTYSISGNEVTLNFSNDDIPEINTFSVSNGQLILVHSPEANGCIYTEKYVSN